MTATDYTQICDELAGNSPLSIDSDCDLTRCTPMIDKENGDERLVVYLPIDESGNPTPSGIGDEVIRLIESYGHSAEFADELDNQAVISPAN